MRGFVAGRESGASFVEAAIVLPVLLIFAAGGVDFARAFTVLSVAQRGLRDGTRFLTTLPQPAVCGWGLDKARNLTVYGNLTGSGTPAVDGWSTRDIVLDTPTSCSGTSGLGVIRLSSTVRYNALIWQSVGLPSTISFRIEHEERWLGE